MATTKKKTAAKRPAGQSRAKTTPVKSSPRTKAVAIPESSRRFMEARFSEQTVYWLLIGAAVVGLAAWVLSLQVQLNEMYDNIDRESTQTVRWTNKTTPVQPQ